MDLTPDSIDPWATAELKKEQERLSGESCAVLHRPRSKTLTIMKARSGDFKVGHVEKIYDSPKAREFALLAGFIPCEGQEFDPKKNPELAHYLGKNRMPRYNVATTP